MSSIRSTLHAYINFAIKLRGFSRNTATLDDIHQHIQWQLTHREENFLSVLKTHVFDYPLSPYLHLFNSANITLQDVETMLKQQDLETTLSELYDAGIYVTFEEFKGRVPIKRNGIEFAPKDSDFDSPNLTPIMFGQTGGSTGRPTRTKMDLEHIAEIAMDIALRRSIYDLLDAPIILWWNILPDTSGMVDILIHSYTGHRIEHWFSPLRGRETNFSLYYIFLTYLMVILARLLGIHFPSPEHVSIDTPFKIAQIAQKTVQKSGTVCISSTTSKCVRISTIAQQHSIDLTGVHFWVAGEPITAAKKATIEASGATYGNTYGSTEMGAVGIGCKNPSTLDDVHFMSNHLALIERPQKVLDQTVNAFHFTSLLPTNPKMLLNVQLDDFGIVEEHDCGCPLYQMGFTKHLRGVSSFRKLTGEGVTLVGSDMVHILEHILPSQFGGSLLDYQLVEEETEQGFTKLVLYVDPSVPIQDENVLLEAFLDAMKNSMPSVRLAQAEYRTGDVVAIRREKPFVTSRGKHFPIRTLNIANQ
jgi:hypothetical protein